MSNLRERAKDIKAQGVEQRGNFNPSGVPLKMYNYWLSLSPSDKATDIKRGKRRENFCHFWRVVAFWAPLWFVAETVVGFFESKTGKVISLAVVGTALAVLFAISPSVRIGFGILAGVVAVAALLVGVGILIDNYWPRKWNKPLGKFFNKAIPVVAVIAAVTAATMGLVFGIMDVGWILILWILGALGLAGGVFYGIACLADYVSGIRADRASKRQDFLDSLTYDEYVAHITKPSKPARAPGKVSKFFSGLGDFIVFVAQIVRVKKWKICPIVTIDSNVQ